MHNVYITHKVTKEKAGSADKENETVMYLFRKVIPRKFLESCCWWIFERFSKNYKEGNNDLGFLSGGLNEQWDSISILTMCPLFVFLPQIEIN